MSTAPLPKLLSPLIPSYHARPPECPLCPQDRHQPCSHHGALPACLLMPSLNTRAMLREAVPGGWRAPRGEPRPGSDLMLPDSSAQRPGNRGQTEQGLMLACSLQTPQRAFWGLTLPPSSLSTNECPCPGVFPGECLLQWVPAPWRQTGDNSCPPTSKGTERAQVTERHPGPATSSSRAAPFLLPPACVD